jgi:hypothetical protein
MGFFKKSLLWVGGFILFIAVVANMSDKEKAAIGGEESAGSVKPASAPAAAEKNKPTITKAEFDAIENGMTYEKVTEIIGGTGEVMSEAGEKGTQFYTILYTFKGEGSLGANANFTFQGGKLQAKAQFGLK